MLVVFFGAVAALTLWTPAPTGAPHAAARAVPHAARLPQKSHPPETAELYSLRARRRIAAYLRLRLLEWREEGLDRAAAVVEHRLGVDALVPGR